MFLYLSLNILVMLMRNPFVLSTSTRFENTGDLWKDVQESKPAFHQYAY
jgi:hypothetical protein